MAVPYTTEELKNLSLEEAKTEMSNRVYEAALFFEQLEGARKIHGNGHHAAQRIAAYAAGDLESRWLGEKRPAPVN